MSFYHRKIPYYKFFKVVDTDGDGIKDTMVYAPFSNFYYLQIGLEQEVRNIGHYNLGVEERPRFEIVDLSTIWNESNNGENDGYIGNNFTGFTSPNTDVISAEGLGFDLISFCNDPNANNYDASLVGVAGFIPCEDNSCCTYTQLAGYGNTNTQTSPTECLAFYTDWGPWNDSMLLNDTNQIYVTKGECTLTFRLINLLDLETSIVTGVVPGGWYGASIKIEIDSGNGFQLLNSSSSYIENINSGIEFNPNGNISLNEKVRIWRLQNGSGNNTSYYLTRPYRDVIIKPPSGSQIRVTYNNSVNPLYSIYYNKLRLQVIKFTPAPPTPTLATPSWNWSQNLPTINNFLGTPLSRQAEGETFHFISISQGSSVSNKLITWRKYLIGYESPSTTLPWGPNNTNVDSGIFYTNPNVNVLYDYNKTTDSSIIQNTANNSINYNSNPFEVLQNFNFTCTVSNNYVSFFDKNGDGFIEYDQNYPNVISGSIDDGLFSRTRYDSPYIFIKPGTKDNTGIPFSNNPLTQASQSQSVAPVSPPSLAGWRNYAHPNPFSLQNNIIYDFKNTSPTCQLGGVDILQNLDINLVDVSNSNIFLPQSDNFITNSVGQATFGTGSVITHLWNYGLTNARGGCCAKTYDSSLTISNDGPYLESKCSQCHGQMTARSAQPVLDNSVRISMQTTDSDVYYGPFYDPNNPTYNGYGLAFSKANKFCRDVKNKNGIQIINSELGTSEMALYIGGILHGGAVQTTPNTNILNNYGVQSNILLGFETVGSLSSNNSCSSTTKLPLKCSKVSATDPNCPSGNCMKCLYCFKCSIQEKQPGVYTGNNQGVNGPNNGITIVE
jgi:hypothetical protein